MKIAIRFRLLVLLLAAGLLFSTEGSLRAQTGDGEVSPVSFKEMKHNFGLVPEEKGLVSYDFQFRNTSTSPLVITRVTTDCGCTTPSYSMDAIAPGAEGKITVSYDPLNRVGSFIKHVRVFTNLLADPIILQISGNVTTLGGGARNEFKAAIGQLQLSRGDLEFPVLSPDHASSVRLVLYNGYDFPVEIKVSNFLKMISPTPTAMRLNAQEPMEVLLNSSVDGNVAPGIYRESVDIAVYKEGKEFDRGQVFLTIPVAPTFGGVKEEGVAPRTRMSTYYDLGKAAKGVLYTGEIAIFNDGKEELELYGIYCAHPAVKLSLSKTSIKSGEQATLKYTIDMNQVAEKGGNLSENIEIMCNDPMGPLRKAKIIIEVEE